MSEPPDREDLSLVCRVGERLCALPLGHVVETMRPLPVEPLPGLPSFVRGVSVIRGAPIPVVDGEALLGTGGGAKHGRFVTLRAGKRHVALAVQEVLGIRDLQAVSLGDLPPLLKDASTEVVSRIGTLDAELLVVLQAARIVPDSMWQATEPQGALTC